MKTGLVILALTLVAVWNAAGKQVKDSVALRVFRFKISNLKVQKLQKALVGQGYSMEIVNHTPTGEQIFAFFYSKDVHCSRVYEVEKEVYGLLRGGASTTAPVLPTYPPVLPPIHPPLPPILPPGVAKAKRDQKIPLNPYNQCKAGIDIHFDPADNSFSLNFQVRKNAGPGRSNDAEPRFFTAIIAGAKLGMDVLSPILSAMGSISRKLALGVENQTGRKWTAINTYFYSGTSDVVLPNHCPDKHAFLYSARKYGGSLAGVEGVTTYLMSDGNTLAVMFSIPFNYWFHSNWWDVRIYKGRHPASKTTFKEMYNGKPYKGKDGWNERHLGYNIKFRGFMTSGSDTKLMIHVSHNSRPFRM